MNKKNQLIKNKIISSFKKNLLLGSLVLSCLIINIYLVLLNVNSGARLSELESSQNKISKINEDISSELVRATSLLTAQKLSQELGFEKTTDLTYLKVTEAVASRF